MIVCCLACKVPYQVKQVRATVEEVRVKGGPYRLWATDVLICPECKNEVCYVDTARQSPIAEHWHPDYESVTSRYPRRLTVNV